MTDYLKEISVDEAWVRLSENADCLLVDVRTKAEWQFVGFPDLASIDKQVIFEEWQVYPTMHVNPDFVINSVKAIENAGGGKATELLFLCRSGVRSQSAAQSLSSEGYSRCINIAGGFEGPPDDAKHRGQIDGWKAHGLPWMQN